MKTLRKDMLTVEIYGSRAEMGGAAAEQIAARLNTLLKEKETVNVIFAAAPSQNEVLEALVADPTIPWERINAFHMDEYIGLPKDAPQGFGNFLRAHIFDRVPFRSCHLIDSTAVDAEEECRRYTELLKKFPTDLVVMGIGENGHIAFNDPPVADFRDSHAVKPVELDAICRQQQVNDGCFKCLEDVPKTAITLTVPTLMAAGSLFCIVPAKTKANAVYNTLNTEIGEACPATALRRHPNAVLYLDADSSSLL